MLLNIALHRSTEEDQQQMFLRYIDELTVWHLRIPSLFQDPPKMLAAKGLQANFYMGCSGQVVESVYSELSGRRDVYDQIVTDLRARGLLNSPSSFLHTTMTGNGMVAKRTTALADAFLTFIAAPPTRSEFGGPPLLPNGVCILRGRSLPLTVGANTYLSAVGGPEPLRYSDGGVTMDRATQSHQGLDLLNGLTRSGGTGKDALLPSCPRHCGVAYRHHQWAPEQRRQLPGAQRLSDFPSVHNVGMTFISSLNEAEVALSAGVCILNEDAPLTVKVLEGHG